MIKRFKILIGLLPVAIVLAVVAIASAHTTTTIILGLITLAYAIYLVSTIAEIYTANTLNLDDIADDLKAIRKLLESKEQQKDEK